MFQNFNFDRDNVLAYNDRIGLLTPLETDYAGAINGKLLLRFIDKANGDDVDIFDEDDSTVIVCGSSEMVLPRLADVNPFVMPKPKQMTQLPPQLFECMTRSLIAMSSKPLTPDEQGLTIIPNGKSAALYATDRATIWHATIEALPIHERMILPVEFCKHAAALNKINKIEIGFGDECAVVEGEDIALYGRLIASRDPLDFPGVVKKHVPGSFSKDSAAIPDGLYAALERAVMLTDKLEVKSVITIADGLANITTTTTRGKVSDDIELRGHPDVRVRVSSKLLAEGVKASERILITRHAALLLQESPLSVYMIGCQAEPEPKPAHSRPAAYSTDDDNDDSEIPF